MGSWARYGLQLLGRWQSNSAAELVSCIAKKKTIVLLLQDPADEVLKIHKIISYQYLLDRYWYCRLFDFHPLCKLV